MSDKHFVEYGLIIHWHENFNYLLNCFVCPDTKCFDGCIPRVNCTTADKGVFVEARYLQMTDLSIPYSIEQRNLKTLVLTEQNAEEAFRQRASVIEKETEQLVSVCLVAKWLSHGC